MAMPNNEAHGRAEKRVPWSGWLALPFIYVASKAKVASEEIILFTKRVIVTFYVLWLYLEREWLRLENTLLRFRLYIILSRHG